MEDSLSPPDDDSLPAAFQPMGKDGVQTAPPATGLSAAPSPLTPHKAQTDPFHGHTISEAGAREHEDWAKLLTRDAKPEETARILNVATKDHGDQGAADAADLLGRFAQHDPRKAETLRGLVSRQAGRDVPFRIAPLGEGWREPTQEEKLAKAPKSPFGPTDGADLEAAGRMAKVLLNKGDYQDAYAYLKSAPEATPPYMAAVHGFMDRENPALAMKFAEQGVQNGMAKPVQLAQANTGTMTDAVPASAPPVKPEKSAETAPVRTPQLAEPSPPPATKPVPVVGNAEATAKGAAVPNPMAQAQGGGNPAQTLPGPAVPARDYGVVADEFGLHRSIGEKAGAKTKEALDALQAFRDGSDRGPAALNKVMEAVYRAESENPQAARDMRGMLLDYKTNSLWQPRVMSEAELKGHGAEDPSKRFGNLAGISGGTIGAVGAALEAAGHEGPGKALGALGRGVSVPMGIAAGIDQVRREALKNEIDRRPFSDQSNISDQLGVKNSGADMSGAHDAMASMLAIRDTDDKAAAVKQAQGKISELKAQNPQAAIVLKNQLDAFISNPASVPALLRQDEIDMFLARGSDFENALGVGSTIFDSAALVAAGTPFLGVAAPVVTTMTLGFSGIKERERQKVEAELARRRLNGRSGKGSGR